MLIINTNKSFSDYLKSLSKSARKNYKYTFKHNQDLKYKKISFDRNLIERFMKLWEQQIIRGRKRHWKFGINHVQDLEKQNRLMVFAGFDKSEPVAVHFIELHDSYIEAHPPMYDKNFGSSRYLAKWMWFSLFKFAMDKHMLFIDMGGGIDTSWQETIKRRLEPEISKYTKYKWQYVPKVVKDNPELEPDYKLINKEILTDKFIVRNDDVSFDTKLSEIEQFCEICDKHNIKIIQAITPFGDCLKDKSAKLDNNQIKAISAKKFSDNVEVLEFLKSRNDAIAVHGLWHTHEPTIEEIKEAKEILINLGLTPTYFVPPFNEGEYSDEVEELKVLKLSSTRGQRLEDFLNYGTPTSETVYLHSWRFDNCWYTFESLDKCLDRLAKLNKKL